MDAEQMKAWCALGSIITYANTRASMEGRRLPHLDEKVREARKAYVNTLRPEDRARWTA